MPEIMVQALWRRRIALLWWSLGILGADALLAIAFPTVRDNSELDQTFANLPPSVQVVLGLGAGALTSPAGYLNSQYFANLLPILLLVFALGLASWCISGDEGAGTLELLLSNPVGRVRVALERAGTFMIGLGALTLAASLGLIILAPFTGLTKGVDGAHILAATAATGLLALVFASLTFAIGAATGVRGLAISIGAVVAVAFFVIEGLAQEVRILRPIREASPWHWFLNADPVRQGLDWQSWVLPLVVSAALIIAGTLAFKARDLR